MEALPRVAGGGRAPLTCRCCGGHGSPWWVAGEDRARRRGRKIESEVAAVVREVGTGSIKVYMYTFGSIEVPLCTRCRLKM